MIYRIVGIISIISVVLILSASLALIWTGNLVFAKICASVILVMVITRWVGRYLIQNKSVIEEIK